jgi:hypothetical protein
MDHLPDEEGSAVSLAAHAVVREANDAGVSVFAGGVHDEVGVVATDGTGGLTIVDVPSREEALRWARRWATERSSTGPAFTNDA